MFAQLLQNPEMLEAAMREIPELQRPEVQETLRALQQNPQMLEQLMRMLDEGQGPPLHVCAVCCVARPTTHVGLLGRTL